MAGANIKMGVTGVNEFKQDINKIKQSMQTLNAALALNEKQFQATGNAEEYLRTKTDLLKTKLDQQRDIVKNAETALKNMKEHGVDKASSAFQSMQRQLINAKGEMLDTETQIKNLGTEAGNAGKGAQDMNKELKKIGKGVGFQNVTDGIKKITDGMASAARTATRLGKTVMRSMMDSTGWADDLLTRSAQMGVDVETLQKMERVSELIDTDVDTIVSAKDKLAKNRKSITELMGIETNGKSADELFWETGEALMSMSDEMDKSEAAQKLFGKSWRELAPLFAAGKETYDSMMDSQNVLTEEQVKKLGEADDAIKSIKQELEAAKNQLWADNADKIIELLHWVVDNQNLVKGALVTIGAGFGALKLAEAAANITKVVNGLKTLGIIKGAAGAAGGAGTAGNLLGGGAATGGSGLVSGLVGKAMGLIGPQAAVLAAGLLPAAIVQGNAEQAARQKQASRVANAGNLGTEGWFLEQSANALGITNGRWGDHGAIESLLVGMNSRTDLEKAKLHNLLSGSYTDQGNSTWAELQRLWGGEEMDTGRLTSILESVATAYDRMAEQTEVLTGGSEKQTQSNSEMTQAAAGLKSLPADMANAVSRVRFNVYLDGNALDAHIDAALGDALAAANP